MGGVATGEGIMKHQSLVEMLESGILDRRCYNIILQNTVISTRGELQEWLVKHPMEILKFRGAGRKSVDQIRAAAGLPPIFTRVAPRPVPSPEPATTMRVAVLPHIDEQKRIVSGFTDVEHEGRCYYCRAKIGTRHKRYCAYLVVKNQSVEHKKELEKKHEEYRQAELGRVCREWVLYVVTKKLTATIRRLKRKLQLATKKTHRPLPWNLPKGKKQNDKSRR